jgi:hypothetical protein
MGNPLPLNFNLPRLNTLMEETLNQNSLSKAVHLLIEAGATFVGRPEHTPGRGAIKDVAVAQKEELQKIGAPR